MYAGNTQEVVLRIIVFWFLLLAHFLADYPLQTNWIVVNKNRARVLFLHVLIHFFVTSIIVLIYAPQSWMFVILLTFIHLLIDMGKNYINRIRPKWVIAPYFIDQFIHILSIGFVAAMMATQSGILPFEYKPFWLIGLITYLVVTYVWYISERIIAFYNPAYFQQVVNQEWSRMLARTSFLSLIIILWFGFSNTAILSLSVFGFPYRQQTFGTRALLTDVAIAIAGAFFILRLV
jgi:hypothetical protein